MSVVLESFPKMSRMLIGKTGYLTAVYEFGYMHQGEMRRLKATTPDTSNSMTATYRLEDEMGCWHPETHNLVTNYRSTISVPSFLFGEKGLAAANGGVLGVALIWMDSEASQRGVEQLGEITSLMHTPVTIKQDVTFPAGKMRGTLVLQTVLYLKNRGNPVGIEKFQAQKTGTVLGILDETRVIIDGNGSMFPIHEVSAPGEPLWWVRCDWTDPCEDAFTDDNFCLYLNKAHESFSALNESKGVKNSPLLKEILSSALTILITKVMNDPSAMTAIMDRSGVQAGSVAALVAYLQNTQGLRFSQDAPEALAIEVRKIVETLL